MLFLEVAEKFKPILRAVLKTWSRYTALIVSVVLHLFTMLTLDDLAASDLYRIGDWCFGGCVNRFLYVLVSLSQKDWVREARVHSLSHSCPKFD